MNGRPLRRRWAAWVAAVALVLPPLSLAPYVTSGTELARLRNALVFNESSQPAFEWTPANAPADFLRDRSAPDAAFVRIAEQLKLAELPDDWQRAVAISRHLLGSAPKLNGGAVQAGLHETYRRITADGDGYCADFVRVFQAIAVAAGMPMRAWAFSFDGYGGHGHVMPEIWNRQRGAWQLVDVFDNVYPARGASDEPLSALELRAALQSGDPSLRALPLHAGARPGFVHEAKLWDYYRRGLNEWYLWWGNNPFDLEQAMGVTLPRPVAQLVAIAQGVQPQAHALATTDNARQRQAMAGLRLHLIAAAALFVAGLVGLIVWAWPSGGKGSRHEGAAHAH